MKDTEAKTIISTLESLKAYYKNKYDTVAEEFEKSLNADTMYRLHKEMEKFEYYCEAIQQSIDAIKPFIETCEKFLSIEDYQENENN